MSARLRQLLALVRPAPLAPFADSAPTSTTASAPTPRELAAQAAHMREAADAMATLGQSLYDQGATESDPRLQEALTTIGKRLYETGCDVRASLPAIATPPEAPTVAHALLRAAHADWLALRQLRDAADQTLVASALEQAFRFSVSAATSPEPTVFHGPRLSVPTPKEVGELLSYACALGSAVGEGRDPHAIRPPVFVPAGRRR